MASQTSSPNWTKVANDSRGHKVQSAEERLYTAAGPCFELEARCMCSKCDGQTWYAFCKICDIWLTSKTSSLKNHAKKNKCHINIAALISTGLTKKEAHEKIRSGCKTARELLHTADSFLVHGETNVDAQAVCDDTVPERMELGQASDTVFREQEVEQGRPPSTWESVQMLPSAGEGGHALDVELASQIAIQIVYDHDTGEQVFPKASQSVQRIVEQSMERAQFVMQRTMGERAQQGPFAVQVSVLHTAGLTPDVTNEIKCWWAKFSRMFGYAISPEHVGVFEVSLHCLRDDMIHRPSPALPWLWFYSCVSEIFPLITSEVVAGACKSFENEILKEDSGTRESSKFFGGRVQVFPGCRIPSEAIGPLPQGGPRRMIHFLRNETTDSRERSLPPVPWFKMLAHDVDEAEWDELVQGGMEVSDSDVMALQRGLKCVFLHYFHGSVNAVSLAPMQNAAAHLVMEMVARELSQTRVLTTLEDGTPVRMVNARLVHRQQLSDGSESVTEQTVDGSTGERRTRALERKGIEALDSDAKQPTVHKAEISFPDALWVDKLGTAMLDMPDNMLWEVFGLVPDMVCMGRKTCTRLRDILIHAKTVTLTFSTSTFDRDPRLWGSCKSYQRITQCSGDKEVRIYNTVQEPRVMEWIQGLPDIAQLTTLDMTGSKLDMKCLERIQRFLSSGTSLTRLQLRDCHLGALSDREVVAVVNLLEACSSVCDLGLGCNQMLDSKRMLNDKTNDKTVATWVSGALSALTQLERLDLGGNFMDDNSLRDVLSTISPSIRHLDLSSNRIGLAEAQEIPSFPSSLESLALGWNRIGASGVQALANRLVECDALSSVDLRANELSAENGGWIDPFLQQVPTVRTLNTVSLSPPANSALLLPTRSLGVSEMWLLYFRQEALASDCLVHIDLSSNLLGDAGTSSFANTLSTLTRLQHLDVSYNQIGPTGAHALAMATTTSVTVLRMRGNALQATGAEHISRLLPQLKEFDVSGNALGADGVANLELFEATALSNLDLSDNNIDDGCAEDIADCLPAMTALTELKLMSNHLSFRAEAIVRAAAVELSQVSRLDLRDQITPPGCVDWEQVWTFCCGSQSSCETKMLASRLRLVFPHLDTAEISLSVRRIARGQSRVRRQQFVDAQSFNVPSLDAFLMPRATSLPSPTPKPPGLRRVRRTVEQSQICLSRWFRRSKHRLTSSLVSDFTQHVHQRCSALTTSGELSAAVHDERVKEVSRAFLSRLVYLCWRSRRAVGAFPAPNTNVHVRAFLVAYKFATEGSDRAGSSHAMVKEAFTAEQRTQTSAAAMLQGVERICAGYKDGGDVTLWVGEFPALLCAYMADLRCSRDAEHKVNKERRRIIDLLSTALEELERHIPADEPENSTKRRELAQRKAKLEELKGKQAVWDEALLQIDQRNPSQGSRGDSSSEHSSR